MRHEIICAGFGGQGILAAGIILANAGMIEGKHVTWMPSYGAEMRGGTANCMVKISEDEIGSPFVDEPGVLLAMNEPSLNRFEQTVRAGGCIFVNSSLVPCERHVRPDVRVIRISASEVATELGDVRVANVLMLGAMVRFTSIVSEQSLLEAIREYFKEKGSQVCDLNEKALKKGSELVTT